MAKIRYICKKCLSEDIWWDATARWNKDLQEFELSATMDYCYCENCDGECNTQEITLEEPNEEKL